MDIYIFLFCFIEYDDKMYLDNIIDVLGFN